MDTERFSRKSARGEKSSSPGEIDRKLTADGEYSLDELVDVERLRGILDRFSCATGLATALVCVPTQELLIRTGCQAKWMMPPGASPGTPRGGLREDRELKSRQSYRSQFGGMRHENGMPEGGVPVVVGGRHLASLFACPCVYREPDSVPHRNPAVALGNGPSGDADEREGTGKSHSETPESAPSFLSELAVFIAEQGLDVLKLRQRTNELEAALAKRWDAEEMLRNAMNELERHVESRAQELIQANRDLKKEIDERKRIEEALSQSERRYRTLFERAGDAIMILDLEGENAGRIVDANQVAAETHGYELSELLTLNIRDLDTPESARRIPERTRRILNGEWLREESTHRRKDGSVFPIEISAAMVEIENHKYVLAIDRDITERSRNEDARRESEARFRALADATFESIFLSENGVCIGQNAAAGRMFGYSSEEAIGKSGTEWIAAGHRQTAMEHMLSGHEEPYEAVALRKDGTTFPCEIQGKMIHHQGRTVRVTALRDTTDGKKAAALLVQAERRKAISDLTSGVAHNFRNWLQVIVGATRVALQDLERESYDQIKTALEKTMKAAQAGAATLRRLEQFAQIRETTEESGDKVFDVSQTLQHAVEMTKTWWKTGPQDHGITIGLKLSLADDAWVMGREGDLFELFVNLIGNASEAIREDGEVSVETLVEPEHVIIRIADTGTGIEPQNLSRIFEPFWTTKAGVGTGLGLSTCLGHAKRHGGSIQVESHVGEGSTFTVTFPRAQAPSDKTKNRSDANLKTGLKILVIDDLDLSAELLQIQLTRLGHDVVAESSANAGLAHLQASDFDLVISDLFMPEMSGWEVGKAIQEICAGKGIRKIPLIVVTGAGEGLLDESRIQESGVNAVMEKPIDTNELNEIISRVVP